MLKLIVSNTELCTNTLPQALTPPENLVGFSAEVRVKGPYLYLMSAQDPSHYLSCELVLEVEESLDEVAGAVICHFPSIESDQLCNFINDDECLYGMAMIEFQMKILEQLFQFCATHYASKLIIYTDDAQANELEIYRDFLSHEGQAVTAKGSQTEMIISVDPKTIADWVAYKDMVTLKFRQTLWQDQRSNPTIKQYLKIYPF
ncbi:MAG: hypothetical protein K2Y18_04710 [Alphaproteobacteria bacterium]|jgi:hypothetical protein|nr:hypothetical protein [Alphaproteobacteria bacterium]